MQCLTQSGLEIKKTKDQYDLTIENKDEIPFQFNQNGFLIDQTEDGEYLKVYYEILGKMFTN